ncbi:MAG TPA: tRNA lysidine(34) synthetase TilS [Burkholderiaceae bacterium]|nr:tRNA lysidine(34) synthetase TilS [Burkholderiaceae bacterium]
MPPPGAGTPAPAGLVAGLVAVATSGGRDSVALLHATVRSASAWGLRVLALHVHHGLQPQADRWLDSVRDLCEQWAAAGLPVAFACARLEGRPEKGASVENWARRERYAALGRLARDAGATIVLLAHHRRDQAETVLLQALRGAGPAGLAAMPKAIVRDGLTWARPWLDEAHEDIEAYVRLHALPTVEDPSNDDPRWARSRLRARVMPALRTAFEDAEQALVAVARHAHEAREVLDEVAREDLARVVDGTGLALAAWRALAPSRRQNALRAWLSAQVPTGVPDSLLVRLADELRDDAPRRWPLDALRTLRSWRGKLRLVTHSLAGPCACDMRLLRCGLHDIPGWPGRLRVFAVEQGGIAPTRLAQVLVRARAGGEQFRRARLASDRSLKKQYQSIGVPPEARGGPLVFDAQGLLLYVPGLGIDARAWASPGVPQWSLRWLPASPEEDPAVVGSR